MKKLVFLALASVLLLSFSMPSAAVAKAPEPFSATIQVAITGPGVTVPAGAGWRTTDEVVTGTVDVYTTNPKRWAALEGATITVTHNSHTLIAADGTILEGNAHAKFVLEKRDGAGTVVGTIVGNYHGKISGYFSIDPSKGFKDDGGWNLVSATGAYAGVQAHGSWAASLAYDSNFGTFVGLATLSGTHH